MTKKEGKKKSGTPTKAALAKFKKQQQLDASKKGAAVSKGNKWWQVRSKHGRDAIFTDPIKMLEAAQEYFEWNETNMMEYEDYVNGIRVTLYKKRMPNLLGLCSHFDTYSGWWSDFKQTITGKSGDFPKVMKLIEDTIRRGQLEGAAGNFYHASIASKILELVDKRDITSGGEPLKAPPLNVYNTAPPMASSEDEIKDKKS